MDFQNQRVLVLGLGQTGLSLLTYLKQAGATVAGFDAQLSAERAQALTEAYATDAWFSGELSAVLAAHDFDCLALSPGVASRHPDIVAFQAQGGLVLGDVAIWSALVQKTDAKVIAITGSNGKSTVTALVGFLCERLGLNTVVAGNIGLPVLDAWRAQLAQPADVWVVELSSFQLDTVTRLNADAVCVLNISEDHLDRYDNLLDYAHSKAKILLGAKQQVLNADDALCRAMAAKGEAIKWFSLARKSDYWVDITQPALPLMQGDQVLLSAEQLPLQGLHNAANVLVALALCEAIGLAMPALLAALPDFRGLAHRVEKIGEKNGVVFIDDSKGTNVGATCAALAGFVAPVLLIAGGDGKGQDFSLLADTVADKAKAVLLIGRDAPLIAAACAHLKVPLIQCATLPEATEKAYALAQAGDIVLLSPACASLDMFDNYGHRAQVFIEAFQSL
ncbi:MAG: UDP-N-acetylmuramoyl-L-alanine--D-glutamate ligase [Neisseriaceae bacterium]|nr:UDP-N-acetylmuramoyl-L-alanine--D-glutamate ligase [Neisseriaceae bacterium]MBP6862247.1 UDP-N-acetylmuramoyl-L-alanine--D-glutamate ligase [Neisseriaceae bacterium]